MASKKRTSKKNRLSNTRSRKKSTHNRGMLTKLCSFCLKLGICLTVVLLAYTAFLDAIVTRKFAGKKWAIPAQVYARPLELYEGKLLNPDELQAQLRRQGYQPVQEVKRAGTFFRQGDHFIIYSRGFHFPDGSQAAQYADIQFQGNKIIALSGRNNGVLPVVRLDPQPVGGIYPANYEDRILIQQSQTPKYLVKALTAVEDRTFYSHWGLSLSSIVRAFLVNMKAGEVLQGGSTLTQQLVKNFYLSNERTLTRKFNEAIMSVLLEVHYSKDEILETYLNEVYLGQHGRRAINGFGLGSRFYFAQPIQELSLDKTALLVGMVKGPSYYNPRRYPERALERRNLVLDILAEEGIVSKAEVARSKRLPLGIVSQEQLNTSAFPAYIDLVKKQLREDYNQKDLTSEGLRIFTNMDPVIQRYAQKSVSDTAAQLNKTNPDLQGAMVVTSAHTGDLLAVVGDKRPGYVGFNRALEAKRPVGSLLKPAIYLTALAQPNRFTLTTPVKDAPIKVKDGQSGFWEPENYGGASRGYVPLQEALAKSYNQAAVQTGMVLGLNSVLRTVKQLGITQSLPPYPAVLLGAVPLSPIDIAHMYQTIASGGYRMPLRAIDAVVNAQGQPLKRYALSADRAFDPEVMALLQHAMVLVMTEGTGRRAYWSISKDTRLAGKSGTTNDHRDSWFAGFSGNVMVVSWMGNDDNSPTTLTGSSGALKAWTALMNHIPVNSIKIPDGGRIKYVWVNPETHHRTDKSCTGAMKVPYISGSEPEIYEYCNGVPSKSPKRFLDAIRSWFD